MLKAELEIENKKLKTELKVFEDSLDQRNNELLQTQEQLSGAKSELSDIRDFYDNYGIDNLTYVEQNIIEQTMAILHGSRKGFGNIIEYTKFLDWCLERYKIIQ